MPTTNVIATASNALIIKGLKKLAKSQFPKKRIIGPKNEYLVDTINKTDLLAVGPFLKEDHLCQYIASSTISHCFDGWNFLSQGISALLSGDISTCIHLVYYSELRAVMSIMACDGIGIFNRRHIYFDSGDNGKTYRKSTHSASNILIDEWATDPSKKSTIFNSIKINNRTLTAWVDATGPVSAGVTALLVKDWFKNWSVDLHLEEDQHMRNLMSYRPHFSVNPVDIQNALQKIIQIWEGLEPVATNKFLDLDRHLLRITIESVFRITTGNDVGHPAFKTFVDHVFATLGESTNQFLYEFIFRRQSPDDHTLLIEAKKDVGNIELNFENPLPMICRAILLLRFATNQSEKFLNTSSIPPGGLTFWWENLAEKFGIIDTTPAGINPIDLYADIADSIADFNLYKSSVTNVHKANVSALPDICSLKQFQRVCFWGLGV